MPIIGADSYYADIAANLTRVNSDTTEAIMISQQWSRSLDKNKSDPINSRVLRDDLLVVVIWTAMGVFGMMTNILILICICQGKKLRQSTSYWLIMSLSFCDIGMLMVCLAHLIPSAVLHEEYVKTVDFWNAFGVFVYDAFWYTGVLHLMVMSINRYVNICRPKHYLNLFSHCKTIAVIFLLYCFGTAIAGPGLFPCCYLVFNHDFYAGQYVPADTPYRYVDMAVNGSSVVVMTFCYVCIVVRVRRSRIMLLQYRKLCREQTKTAMVYAKSTMAGRHNSVSTKLARLLRSHAPIASRREVRLFFQFATVSIIFFLTFFTWSWLPHLSSDSKWIGFAVTSLFFVNNSINPIVYLIFNSVLRRQIQKMFCPFSGQEHAVAVERKPREAVITQQEVTVSAPDRVCGKGRRHISLLRRLRSSGSVRNDRADDPYKTFRRMRRRSTAFEPDDDARLLRISADSCNDTTDNGTDNNATCNLMAMAAFMNATTITSGVLLRTIKEDEERRMLAPGSVVHSGSDVSTIRLQAKISQSETEATCSSSIGDNCKESEAYLNYSDIMMMDDEPSIHL